MTHMRKSRRILHSLVALLVCASWSHASEAAPGSPEENAETAARRALLEVALEADRTSLESAPLGDPGLNELLGRYLADLENLATAELAMRLVAQDAELCAALLPELTALAKTRAPLSNELGRIAARLSLDEEPAADFVRALLVRDAQTAWFTLGQLRVQGQRLDAIQPALIRLIVEQQISSFEGNLWGQALVLAGAAINRNGLTDVDDQTALARVLRSSLDRERRTAAATALFSCECNASGQAYAFLTESLAGNALRPGAEPLAMEALVALGSTAVPTLTRALDDERIEVREAAVRALARIAK